jgi:hypothetical protein
MSRSNPRLSNPAVRKYEWAGGKGILAFYDREQKKVRQVKLPTEFLPLDQLSTIVGYNKTMKQGYWANEVRNTVEDMLYVRTKQGPFEAGLYQDLTQSRSKGGKFAKVVYAAALVDGEFQIVKFVFAGSALSAWIEFANANNVENGKVIIERGDQQESDVGPFFPPKFTFTHADPDENGQAMALDRELQQYLLHYLNTPQVDDDAHGYDDSNDNGFATPEQKRDFENKRRAAFGDNPGDTTEEEDDSNISGDDIVIDDLGDEPINLDDIPF